MFLILALGSNIGDRVRNLKIAKKLLSEQFEYIAESILYETPPVDYLFQDYFINQLVEFKIEVEVENEGGINNTSRNACELPPAFFEKLLHQLQEIELLMGRHKTIPKGPRLIDIDIIFLDILSYAGPNLEIPHPAWKKRNFIHGLLPEMPSYSKIQQYFPLPREITSSESYLTLSPYLYLPKTRNLNPDPALSENFS
jgi:2-amino-4-hydroxy-6-hydroxymethyldihydropteridine diphosphokinase